MFTLVRLVLVSFPRKLVMIDFCLKFHPPDKCNQGDAKWISVNGTWEQAARAPV